MAREPIKIPRRLVELLCAGGEYADYGLYRQDGSWWGTWTVNGRRRHEAIEADNAEDAATWLVAIVSKGGPSVHALLAEVEAAQDPRIAGPTYAHGRTSSPAGSCPTSGMASSTVAGQRGHRTFVTDTLLIADKLVRLSC